MRCRWHTASLLLLNCILLPACVTQPTASVPAQQTVAAPRVTPEQEREHRLRAFRNADVTGKITSSALANHDALTYIKTAITALRDTYTLDLNDMLNELRQDNATEYFYKAMQTAYLKNPDVPPDKIEKTAVEAMLKLIDAHSKFLDAEEFEELRVSADNRAAVGLELKQDTQGIRVVDVLEDGPAMRANIPVGSYILAIDDNYLAQESLADVVGMLRGNSGSLVNLTVKQADNQIRKYQLRREFVKIKYAMLKSLPQDILYLRIKKFSSNLEQDILAELNKFDTTARGFIVDLRANQGGLLAAVVSICDMFLPAGEIMHIEGKTEENNKQFMARTGQALEYPMSLVILVDSQTAVGAELLALVLRHRLSAYIIGSQTYGYAGIRTMQYAGRDTMIAFTTARMRLPNGQTWHDQGIRPDICVDYARNIVVQGDAKQCPKSDYTKPLSDEQDVAVQEAIRFITTQPQKPRHGQGG